MKNKKDDVSTFDSKSHKKPHPNPKPQPQPSSSFYTLLTEPDQGTGAIYNLLSSAKTSIDMTMYELIDATVIELLSTAAAQGVKVRVILDQNEEKERNTTAFNALNENRVSVHWANPSFSCTHQKTITIDSATSVIMTLNLTAQDYPTSRDFAVITNNVNDIAAIQATFNADFIDASITPPTGDNLVWSPTNSRSSLLALINGAQKSLLISQEEFEDSNIENAILAALGRNVSVTLVQENVQDKFTKTLNALKNTGAQIAVYSSQTGYYIHAKAILADYGTSAAKLFIGSENFSTYSLDRNRELGLIFTDAACMAGVQAALTKDFNQGTKF